MGVNPGAGGLEIAPLVEDGGELDILKAWYTQAKEWTEVRYGTAKQHREDVIRKAFSEHQNSSTGRWEMESFKQQLSVMEGRRIEHAARRAAAPMAVG